VRAEKFEVRLSTIGEALYASDTRDSRAYKSAQEMVLSKKLTDPNLATVVRILAESPDTTAAAT
jgi:hypothetical protein